METKQEIMSLIRDEVGIVIRQGDGDKVILSWTDYVINQWDEEYDNLAQALTRCALLIECEMSDWELGFTMTPEQHSDMHRGFVSDCL
jgi:hypothetical protein